MLSIISIPIDTPTITIPHPSQLLNQIIVFIHSYYVIPSMMLVNSIMIVFHNHSIVIKAITTYFIAWHLLTMFIIVIVHLSV